MTTSFKNCLIKQCLETARGNMSMSGKFEFSSGNCQGNVREFCFHQSVATLSETEALKMMILG